MTTKIEARALLERIYYRVLDLPEETWEARETICKLLRQMPKVPIETTKENQTDESNSDTFVLVPGD
jgi:hypothetical protein